MTVENRDDVRFLSEITSYRRINALNLHLFITNVVASETTCEIKNQNLMLRCIFIEILLNVYKFVNICACFMKFYICGHVYGFISLFML